jgi:hypothetical protein
MSNLSGGTEMTELKKLCTYSSLYKINYKEPSQILDPSVTGFLFVFRGF